ncbi:transposable element Tcb2 transposase [Octopus vulgaris]|uniref:Transposable element Tcb2 transposase n=1 Tax=Octopus vulgaris TaxID=6645 RepID=A0AA36AZV9_OCTVU|nr:transposable element Tcb2 transposase [Octopus vulgaris]
MIRMSLYNGRATIRQLAEEMQKMTGKQLSTTTVKTRLLEAGLKSCRAAQNRKRQLLWARAHKTWTVQQWRTVMFTDESRFSLVSDKPVHVRRRRVGLSKRMFEMYDLLSLSVVCVSPAASEVD